MAPSLALAVVLVFEVFEFEVAEFEVIEFEVVCFGSVCYDLSKCDTCLYALHQLPLLKSSG